MGSKTKHKQQHVGLTVLLKGISLVRQPGAGQSRPKGPCCEQGGKEGVVGLAKKEKATGRGGDGGS